MSLSCSYEALTSCLEPVALTSWSDWSPESMADAVNHHGMARSTNTLFHFNNQCTHVTTPHRDNSVNNKHRPLWMQLLANCKQ